MYGNVTLTRATFFMPLQWMKAETLIWMLSPWSKDQVTHKPSKGHEMLICFGPSYAHNTLPPPNPPTPPLLSVYVASIFPYWLQHGMMFRQSPCVLIFMVHGRRLNPTWHQVWLAVNRRTATGARQTNTWSDCPHHNTPLHSGLSKQCAQSQVSNGRLC